MSNLHRLRSPLPIWTRRGPYGKAPCVACPGHSSRREVGLTFSSKERKTYPPLIREKGETQTQKRKMKELKKKKNEWKKKRGGNEMTPLMKTRRSFAKIKWTCSQRSYAKRVDSSRVPFESCRWQACNYMRLSTSRNTTSSANDKIISFVTILTSIQLINSSRT